MGSHAAVVQQEPKPTWVPGPIIVGAGPSGLAAAACLHRLGVPYALLEQSQSIASLWLDRTYDRLKLHLPKHFCHLPHLPFPLHFPKYPSKHHFLSYLHSYAQTFSVSPRFNSPVRAARYDPSLGAWAVRTGTGRVGVEVELVSSWLIVATGKNAEPVVPELPGLERFCGRCVIHTSQYKSGAEFEGERVLVVGCGNSGMEVSLDLCRHNAEPFLVVRNNVHVLPREMLGFSTFGIATALLRWVPVKLVDRFLLALAHLALGDTDRLGIHRPKTGPIELTNLTGKTPVLDVGTLAQIKSGRIKVMGGIKEITREGAKFVDGREEEFDSIILATGYRSNVPSWLKDGADLFSKEGMPKTPFPNGWKGEKGLYCVGFTGRGLLGTSSDALNVAGDIYHQWKETNSKVLAN